MDTRGAAHGCAGSRCTRPSPPGGHLVASLYRELLLPGRSTFTARRLAIRTAIGVTFGRGSGNDLWVRPTSSRTGQYHRELLVLVSARGGGASEWGFLTLCSYLRLTDPAFQLLLPQKSLGEIDEYGNTINQLEIPLATV